MAYITRHTKRDGTVEVSVNDGGKRMTLEHDIGSPKTLRRKREVVYNFSRIDNNGKFLSPAARRRQISDHLAQEREMKADHKKGEPVKTHSIAAELYWQIRAEQGVEAVMDRNYVKKVAEANGMKL